MFRRDDPDDGYGDCDLNYAVKDCQGLEVQRDELDGRYAEKLNDDDEFDGPDDDDDEDGNVYYPMKVSDVWVADGVDDSGCDVVNQGRRRSMRNI